jgi:hypothetical protein
MVIAFHKRHLARDTTCDAIVMPGKTEPLLGAIPMEGMDVVKLVILK